MSSSILLAFLLTRTPEPPPQPAEKLEPGETDLWQKRNFAATPISPLDQKEPGPSVTQEKATPQGGTEITFDEEKLEADLYKQDDNPATQRLIIFCVTMLGLSAYPIIRFRRAMGSRAKPAKRRLPRRELTIHEWAAGRQARRTEAAVDQSLTAAAPEQRPTLLFRPSPPCRRECE